MPILVGWSSLSTFLFALLVGQLHNLDMNRRLFLLSAISSVTAYLTTSNFLEKHLVETKIHQIKPVHEATVISFNYHGKEDAIQAFLRRSEDLTDPRVSTVLAWRDRYAFKHTKQKSKGRYVTTYTFADSATFESFYSQLKSKDNQIGKLRKSLGISLDIYIS